MLNAPLLPQPNIPNYTESQDQNLQKEQKNSTGGELLEIAIDKVRRITIKGQIDGS